MVRSALILLLLSGLGWSIACSPPATADRSDPGEVMARYDAASRANDWAALYEVVSDRARAGRTLSEFVASGAQNPDFAQEINARSTVEVLSIQIEGERAIAKARVAIPDMQGLSRPVSADFLPTREEVAAAPLSTFERDFELVREEGVWRVDMKPLGLPEAPVDRNLERVRSAAEQFDDPADAGGPGG